ncbi:MAG: VanZ family protein [Firmicutes bacterium]|nr:VanZ family protein [Bacillota bacterium]
MRRRQVLFFLYALGMLWLLFWRGRVPGAGGEYWAAVRSSVNLVPLRTLRLMLRLLSSPNRALARFAAANLAGNVAAFLPLGYFLPALWRRQRRFFAFSLTALLLIALVELAQLLTLRGSCDIDDLILNYPGALLGWAGCRIFSHKE